MPRGDEYFPGPTPAELLKEAVEIADGQTLKLGTTEHVKALVAEMRRMTEERVEYVRSEMEGG